MRANRRLHQLRLALGLLDLGEALTTQRHMRTLCGFLRRRRGGGRWENRGLREGYACVVGREAGDTDVVVSLCGA
jgi:hypothetical protein